jgi:hypothetical protein
LALTAHAESVKPAALTGVKKPVSQWCTPLVSRLPKISLAQCQNSALEASGAVSQKGFPLLIRDIPANNNLDSLAHKQPIRILLIGGIHGDEKTASAIVFKWLDKFRTPSFANEFHWKIAPVVNPDGLLASKSTRVNANGVDLNRNFPTPNWLNEAPQYWRKKTQSDPRRFPGKAPLSEPESRWIFNQMEQFQPDVIISVHAPFGVLDFDGSGTPPTKFGRLMFNRVGVYPGSLGNYGGVHKDIPVVTIELPNSQQMPSEAEVARIWQDMLSWVQLNISPQVRLAEK